MCLICPLGPFHLAPHPPPPRHLPHSPSTLAHLDAPSIRGPITPSSAARPPSLPAFPWHPAFANLCQEHHPPLSLYILPSSGPYGNLARASGTSLPSPLPRTIFPPASFPPKASLLFLSSRQLLNFFRVLWLYTPHHKSPSCLLVPPGPLLGPPVIPLLSEPSALLSPQSFSLQTLR